MEDLSPEPPKRKEPEGELLAPHREAIDSWPGDDRGNWRKQRHTAVRVHVRLRDGRGYEGSYSTARRHARQRREEMARERDRRDAEGFLRPGWPPGEIQVDFGEADLGVRGVTARGKYLTVTFPHSNVGLTQVFWGETAECVCQGLRSALESMGGVPRRAVLDNATEVGRRVGETVRVSGPFRRFAAHYGLDHALANPYSGNERGNVENKVGCHGRDPSVPVPSFHDVASSDERLPRDCLDLSGGKRHHGLGTPGPGLFGEDGEALSPLPPAAFSCAGWETRKCGKQGTFALGGVHRYSAGPAYARCEVAVALGAFDVTVCDVSTGEAIATHGRQWGGAPTDSSDPTPRPGLPCMRPAGWRDSSVRASLPEELVAFLDGEPADSLKADPGVLRDESAERGWGAAVEGMARSLAATGGLDRATASPSAARAAAGDERAGYGEEVDLGACDGAPRLLEGGGRHAADELGARGLAGRLPWGGQGALRIGRHDGCPPRLRDAGAGGGMHGDARVGDRPPRQDEGGEAAPAGEVPRAQGARRLRPVERGPPRRLGARRDVLAGIRARRRGPRLLRPDGARQGPHGHGPRHRGDLGGLPGGVLADRAAGAPAGEGQEGGHARQAARGHRQGKAPRPGRVRPRPLRRGRGKAALPGHIREPRGEERHIRRQRRVRQVGHGPRGRRARRRDRGPRRAPRQARRVRRTQPQARGEPHAGEVWEVGTAARP